MLSGLKLGFFPAFPYKILPQDGRYKRKKNDKIPFETFTIIFLEPIQQCANENTKKLHKENDVIVDIIMHMEEPVLYRIHTSRHLVA